MMLRSGQRMVSPPPFLPPRPLHPQGNLAPSTQLPSQPTLSSSPLHQVTVKEEPQVEKLIKLREDLHMPPPGLAAERFTPYTGYLPSSSIKTTVVKQEPGETLPNHPEPVSGHNSEGLAEAASTAAGSLGLKNMHSAVKDRVPYAWVDEYTPQQASHLALTASKRHLAKADRKDFPKTLEAAKTTILDLMTEEQRRKFDLEDVPAYYTGLKRTARQLELIVPTKFLPKGPGILPMDKMMRAVRSYIGHLRGHKWSVQRNAAQAENFKAPDTQVAPGPEPSDGIVNKNENGAPPKSRKEKVSGRKGKKKAQSSGENTSDLEIQTKPEATKKRKHRSDYDTEEDLGTKSSKQKKKKQKLSTPPVEQEMPEPEVKEPEAKNKKKKKQGMIQYPPTEEDVPEKALSVKKRKKNTSPASEENVPEPAIENREKRKKSSVSDEKETSEDPQTEPAPLKRRRKRKNLIPVEEEPSRNLPEPSFDADASFLGEALETTEEKNHNLNQEIQNLKAILQAFGVTGARLSVALTRMRHGQSAEDIFMGVKREDRED